MAEIIERAITEFEDMDRYAAKAHICEVVLLGGRINPAQRDSSLFSGFDGATALQGDIYEPVDVFVTGGELCASTAEEWYYQRESGLADVGNYAVRHENPSVGVYDREHFRRARGLFYIVKPGITIPEACRTIFVWR